MRTWTFDVEITRFAPEPIAERFTTSNPGEAEAMVRERADEVCFVMVTQREGDLFGDDFYLWLAGGRACVRRDEHREWYAIDPAWAVSAAGGDRWFRDEEGTWFPVQDGETLSPSQALDALGYWLRTGELLPTLTWT